MNKYKYVCKNIASINVSLKLFSIKPVSAPLDLYTGTNSDRLLSPPSIKLLVDSSEESYNLCRRYTGDTLKMFIPTII